MKKTFVFVVLLLSLFAYKVNAAPNTGPVPEDGVKINFNANGTYMSIEGDGWMIDQQDGSMTLTKGEVIITLNEYMFNDDEEIIGFSWMIEGATAVLWVKHGTTEEIYGDGTSGVFITSDNKQISNVVFLIEMIVDEDDDDDDEVIDDEDDDEEEVIDEDDDDEEEVVDEDDDDEVLGEEEEDDEEVVVVVEEEDDDEDAVLGEAEESLPNTSDATAGLGLLSGLFGFMMLFATKKKNLLG